MRASFVCRRQLQLGLFARASPALQQRVATAQSNGPFIASFVESATATADGSSSSSSSGDRDQLVQWTQTGCTPRVFHWAHSTGKKAVGRWMSGHEQQLRSVEATGSSSEEMWSRFRKVSQPAPTELPSELASLDPQRVHSIFLLTDATPQPLLRALDKRFPQVVKYGVVVRQTPFETGREYTLMCNDKVHDKGAVGVVWVRDEGAPAVQPRVSMQWTGVEPIGAARRIARCQGNVVLAVGGTDEEDDVDAVRHLLDDIQRQSGPVDKEVAFYAALYSSKPHGETQPLLVAQITAGDPARGFLSLDTEDEVQTGWYMQFLRGGGGTTARLEMDDVGLSVHSADGVIAPLRDGGRVGSLTTRMLRMGGVTLSVC